MDSLGRLVATALKHIAPYGPLGIVALVALAIFAGAVATGNVRIVAIAACLVVAVLALVIVGREREMQHQLARKRLAIAQEELRGRLIRTQAEARLLVRADAGQDRAP